MIWRLPGRAARSSAPPAIDRARFEAEILPHLDSAANFARWKLRDATLAEDVVQEAMLRAFTYFPGFRGGDGRAWLLQIVRNTAWSRPRGPRLEALDDDAGASLIAPGPDPEAALALTEAHSQLSRMMARLPAELRECLALRELEDMSYRDIAEVTGVPVGTVMSRLFRARKLLLGQAQGNPE